MFTSLIPSRIDVTGFLFAVLLHVPLFLIRLDPPAPAAPRPSSPLVSINLIQAPKPKPVMVPLKIKAPMLLPKLKHEMTVPVSPLKPLREIGRGPSMTLSIPVPQKIAEIPLPIESNKFPFKISGALKDRAITRQVQPRYPDWAQAKGIEASVTLQFTVRPDGSVALSIIVKRTSGYADLDQTAIQALLTWEFAALERGETREEVGLITFNYSLD